jgi:hypothetical protein
VYCRSCNYRLDGLPAGKCPECAATFDPADPASYESHPARRRRLVQHAIGLGTAVTIGALAWFGFRLAAGVPFGSYHPAFLAHVAIGLPLGVAAAAIAAQNRSWPGRIALLLVAILCLWAALLLGVARGYSAWQTMPDPPPEAFADGGPLMGSLILGWFPAAIVVTITFIASWLVSWALRRRTRSDASRT